ncbi:MAG: hypothetical protein ABEH78_07630 [Haloferacaceae archaeon]
MFDPTDLLRGPAGWLLAVLVANLAIILVAHALLVVGLGSGFGTGAGTTSTGRADEGRDVDGADDRVRCPNCRTANEPGYRFCRQCLGELPGGGRAGAGASAARRRPLP